MTYRSHSCSQVPLSFTVEEEGNSFANMGEIDLWDNLNFHDPSSPLSKEAKRVRKKQKHSQNNLTFKVHYSFQYSLLTYQLLQSLDKHEIIDIVEKFVDNIVMKCQVKHYSEIDKIRNSVSPFLFI